MIENDIRRIDLSIFHVYRAMSNGFSWANDDILNYISMLLKDYSISDIVNNSTLINMIGVSFINMQYKKDQFGKYNFILPVFVDTNKDDIVRKNNIGIINAKLIKEIIYNTESDFIKTLSFILYNDRIVVDNDSNKYDVNIINIIFNVISIYILQTYRRLKNERRQ